MFVCFVVWLFEHLYRQPESLLQSLEQESDCPTKEDMEMHMGMAANEALLRTQAAAVAMIMCMPAVTRCAPHMAFVEY